MPVYKNKYHITKNTTLNSLVLKSKKALSEYKSSVFKTATLKELMTDKFEYSGEKPNTLLVKNLENGEPVELNVLYDLYDISPKTINERWILYDSAGNTVGYKDYGIEKDYNNKISMKIGTMHNFNKNLKGIGTRLDQLQIERALCFNINSIPRTALPQSTFYHALMGFLPSETTLVEIKNNNLERAMKKAFYFIENIDFDPIIIMRNNRYYIDVNKTLACTNFKNSKEAYNSEIENKRVPGRPSFLTLSGEELLHWKNILKEHSLLDKLNFEFPHF